MTETHLIMGLPKAGKTTFIAALWYVVEAGRVPGALKLVELPKNRKHLIEIQKLWVGCQEQKHTHSASEKEITLKLQDETGRTTELVIPDMSGESFELQWSHRQWTLKYHRLALAANGAMLFVHPDHVADSATIGEEVALASVIASNESGDRPLSPVAASDDPTHTPTKAVPWDADFASSQVKLTELLQFLTLRPLKRDKFRLSVVVSAWDKAKIEGFTPTDWVRHRMPLLDQFLRANHEIFQHEVFGISAIGGALGQDEARLLAYNDPVDRIEVVGPQVQPHDITAPV